MIPAIVAAVIVGGAALAALSDDDKKRGKEELEKLKAKEIKTWNKGKCPRCGRPWHAHRYFPPNSEGKYEFTSIRCYNCKIRATLEVYVPPGSEWKDITPDPNADD